MRRIAPPGLLGREPELADLAAFCTRPGKGSYAWWRGGAWAGKSALLASFVLRPPPQIVDQVTMVSFFITARLAAQDTREAFTQVLLDQLASLTGQDLPAALPEATRDAFLLDLLDRAAARCQEAGRRLVLVVDGLDEDRSITTGPDAHSIAGLLPADLPSGMRVIVSGRPDPPVPDDVPDWHPLRDLAIVRLLDPSPYARDIARLARQELGRLLHGIPAEQDMLGLLTAARGNLSAADLAALTGLDLWEAEDIARRVQGRTFASRPSQYRPGAAPEVYLLGHEELQATALSYLARRLPGYYGKLAAWAGSWWDAGWPADTPEYLLSGYFQLLAGLGDVPALAALACDAARHDRMLDLTGGDAAAITETRTALDAIAGQEDPGLGDALHLAWHRDHLASRNASIPHSLPAVWAVLGNTTRAFALASSTTSPHRQAQALTQVADSLARAGQHDQAETLARSITGQHAEEALVLVADGMARTGQHERAETVARSITDPDHRARALAQLAMALTAAGDTAAARRITAAALATGAWHIAAGPALTLSDSAWARTKPAL